MPLDRCGGEDGCFGQFGFASACGVLRDLVHVAVDHPASPQVCGPFQVSAVIMHKGHQRRTDRFAGLQICVQVFLSGRKARLIRLVAVVHGHGPLAGPADRIEHALVAVHEIKIGRVALRASAAVGLLGHFAVDRYGVRLVRARIADAALEPGRFAFKHHIDRVKLAYNGGVCRAVVCNVDCPVIGVVFRI